MTSRSQSLGFLKLLGSHESNPIETLCFLELLMIRTKRENGTFENNFISSRASFFPPTHPFCFFLFLPTPLHESSTSTAPQLKKIRTNMWLTDQQSAFRLASTSFLIYPPPLSLYQKLIFALPSFSFASILQKLVLVSSHSERSSSSWESFCSLMLLF